jgi:tetratricopeptide (TPR) repeat protein
VAALPRSRPVRIVAAGLVVSLLAAGGLAIRSCNRGETPVEREAREYARYLEKLSSPDTGQAAQAAAELLDRRDLLARPDRLADAAVPFSGPRLLGSTGERLDAARTFWRNILLLGERTGLLLFPPELTRLRHAIILDAARRETPREVELLAEGEGGPRILLALEELATRLFSSPVPPREALGGLLWDRANLEEMAGLALDALESCRQLSCEKVYQREFADRPSFIIAKADLLGRIARRIPADALARDPSLAVAIDPRKDEELEKFRSEEGGAFGLILDGIHLFHRGDPLGAAAAFDRYLAAQRKESGNEADPFPIHTRILQTVGILRATARLEAARAAFREAEAVASPAPLIGLAARRFLELRRARILAAVGLRAEFEDVRGDFPPGDIEGARFLSALAETVWGDRPRGAAELQKLVAGKSDLPDAAAWEEIASGLRPPLQRALFEVGRACDELGDLSRLERTIARLESAVETEAEEGYLAFLRAVLRFRRGEVAEAWGDLERLLETPSFPPGLSRRDVARFMGEAEEAADLLTRARSLIDGAERDLTFLRARAKEIDGTLARIVSIRLWIARIEGEAIDPAGFGPRRKAAADLFADLRDELAVEDEIPYAFDRAWIDIRNAAARNFRALARARRFDEALERLGDLSSLLGAGGRRALLPEEAAVLRDRAAFRDSTGDQEGAVADLRRSGELFLAVADVGQGESEKPEGGVRARAEGSAALERAGDPEGVIRALAPVEHASRDPALLLRLGKALLARGELRRAREVLRRSLATGQVIEQVVEEPGDPVNLGGHFFREPPADLLSWLELYSFVDPANGTGAGRLRFDAVRRTVQWRAPGESRYGRPVFLEEEEAARVQSGDDTRKAIFVTPRRKTGEDTFPAGNGEWELVIASREALVDPVGLEARLADAEATIRLARLPRFEDDAEALEFAARGLEGAGQPRLRTCLCAMVEKSLGVLLGEPSPAAGELRDEFDRAIAAWRSEIAEERASQGIAPAGRLDWLEELEKEIDALAAAASDPARLEEALARDTHRSREKLRSFYRTALRALLAKEGAGGRTRGTIDELARDLLDEEARDDLLFLCENLGNRSAIWKRAMYLRAVQAERRAEESRSGMLHPTCSLEASHVGYPASHARYPAAGDRSVLGAPPDPAGLIEEARDIYSRLLAVAGLADGPEWIARSIHALARIEGSAGRTAEARSLLDRLADGNPTDLGKGVLPSERVVVERFIRSAAFERADLARRTGDTAEAARLYADAIARHGRSSLALWGHLQLGACYEEQGLSDEAYREYRKGKGLLADGLSPGGLDRWPREERARLAEGLRAAFPAGDAEKAVAAIEGKGAGGERELWARLFDERLKALPRR